MDELVKNLNNVGWWLSAVVVGVLINFLSQYLYPKLAAIPTKSFDKMRSVVEEHEAETDRQIKILQGHPALLPLYIAVETRQYWLASFLFGGAIFMLLWVIVASSNMIPNVPEWFRPLTLGMSAFLMLSGMLSAQRGFKYARIVSVATREW